MARGGIRAAVLRSGAERKTEAPVLDAGTITEPTFWGHPPQHFYDNTDQ